MGYERFKDAEGKFRWRLRALNGEIVSQSEAYTREADAKRGLFDATQATLTALIQALAGPLDQSGPTAIGRSALRGVLSELSERVTELPLDRKK